MTIGDRIRSIRKTLCLSQADFARAINVTPSSVCNYEKANRSLSCATIRKIVKFTKEQGMNLTYQDFLDDMDGIENEPTQKAG